MNTENSAGEILSKDRKNNKNEWCESNFNKIKREKKLQELNM